MDDNNLILDMAQITHLSNKWLIIVSCDTYHISSRLFCELGEFVIHPRQNHIINPHDFVKHYLGPNNSHHLFLGKIHNVYIFWFHL
jgi:hypothetical protein